MSLDYLVSILKIILFDLVLSGDNAVVIGLAAHMLPPRQRRQAMIWGCGMAIAMRVALTLVVAHLLLFPGLRLIGGLLLVWIACKLVQEEEDPTDSHKSVPTTLFKAVTRIALADFIMSLDNIVAIAGVSQSDPVRIILGLFLSITILLLMSAVVTEIMNRYRWIAYAGAAVLAWTAAEMMVHDLEALYAARWGQDGPGALMQGASWLLRIGTLLLCLTTKLWWPRSSHEHSADSQLSSASLTEDPSEQPMERILD
jgi:YjbE family integral membrane protein